jgi:hypothetical protein
MSKISGVGRSAIGDWLAGKSLPRSWDDGAVLVVDAIIKIAARYGKRFPDEEAVRQRCKDAYDSAKSTPQSIGVPTSGTPILDLRATEGLAEGAPSRAASDEPGPSGSVPGSAALSGWRTSVYAVVAVVVFAILAIVAVALAALGWPVDKQMRTPVAELLQDGALSGTTQLRSAKSEKCVTVDGDADGARAFQFGCTDAPGRTWYLQRAVERPTAAHLFRIVNASNSKCLSYSDELFGGARVVAQRPCARGNDQGQTWSFVLDPDRSDGWAYGRLTNMRSSQCLDVNGENVDDGTPIIQWYCGDKLNQLFKVMKKPNA